MNAFPTGTITFLFTDVAGSTQLWEKHPDAMKAASARHDVLLKQAVQDSGDGTIVKTTGDGIMAAFHTAPDALRAAFAAQQALQNEPWPEFLRLSVRMGLHTGTAELRGGDYFGSTVNRTARLMDAAHGGQVLLSDAAQELCWDALSPPFDLLCLGTFRLKDLTRPETVYQLFHPDLPETFPPLRTLDAAPNNLPRQLTSFVGREDEVKEVKRLLESTCLLTLTGTAGSGKTRLALQVAADLLDGYPNGVWLIELASLSDPSRLPQTVAEAFGIKEKPGQTMQQTLLESLKPKRLLLMMDNCEHLLASCTTFIALLLRACPDLRVLATSRELLGIAGELPHRVPSLSLPDPKRFRRATVRSLSQYEAVRLFVERAQAAKSDFVPTDAVAPVLARICARLDGIPLALELAAARVRSLSVEDINTRLEKDFELLTGGDRSALPRQRTLRALVDWSYDLLSLPEKILIARLSVFSGGWTLQAAEKVCGFAPINESDVLDLLTSLTDKSLVQADEEGGATRFRMLHILRQYATEKRESGSDNGGSSTSKGNDETAVLQRRHRNYFVALAEEAEPQLTGPEQAKWLTRLETEHDNLRAALFCCSTDTDITSVELGLRLSGALWRFWAVRGYFAEGREYLRQALSRVASRPVAASIALARAKALGGAGNLARSQSDYEAARVLHEQSLALRRELGDKQGIAAGLGNLGILAYTRCDYETARTLLEQSLVIHRELENKPGIAAGLGNLGLVASDKGDLDAARTLHEESLLLFRGLGDKQNVAMALSNLGFVASDHGDFGAARALYEESLLIHRELKDKQGIAAALSNLGFAAYSQNDYQTARTLHEESLVTFHELEDKQNIAYALGGLAEVFLREGNARKAVVLWAASDTLRTRLSAPLPPDEQAKQDAQVTEARAVLSASDEAGGEAAFYAALKEGRALTLEQAVSFALGPLARP